jgi:hypothetical protein
MFKDFDPRRLSRRDFLKFGPALLLAACGPVVTLKSNQETVVAENAGKPTPTPGATSVILGLHDPETIEAAQTKFAVQETAKPVNPGEATADSGKIGDFENLIQKRTAFAEISSSTPSPVPDTLTPTVTRTPVDTLAPEIQHQKGEAKLGLEIVGGSILGVSIFGAILYGLDRIAYGRSKRRIERRQEQQDNGYTPPAPLSSAQKAQERFNSLKNAQEAINKQNVGKVIKDPTPRPRSVTYDDPDMDKPIDPKTSGRP